MTRTSFAVAALFVAFVTGCGSKSNSDPIQPEPTPEEMKALQDHQKTVNEQERAQYKKR